MVIRWQEKGRFPGNLGDGLILHSYYSTSILSKNLSDTL